MGRINSMQKKPTSVTTPVDVAEMKEAIPESFMLNPNVDYGEVTNQISKLEELGKVHPMSRSSVAPSPSSNETTVADFSFQRPTAPKMVDSSEFYTPPQPMHTPVDASLTGKSAIGKRIAPTVNDKTLRSVIVTPPSELKKQAEELEKSYPPIEDDFLSFLIEKQPLSFGWVVDNTFLTNFDMHPEVFDEKEKFIFWVVPASVNIFKISSAGGFQKSESRTQQIHPHIFLIKILEIPEGHEEEDPFTGIINDVRYINLRETLEKRGIQFIYDHNANRIWSSIICGRLKIK